MATTGPSSAGCSSVQRTLKITNAYDTGDVIVTDATVEVSGPEGYTPEEYHEYLMDELFQYTGTGRTKGNSIYEVDSTDGLHPPIHLEFG